MIDKTKCSVKTLDMWESMACNASHRSPYNDWIVGEWKLDVKDRFPRRRMLTARVFYSEACTTRRNAFRAPRATQHAVRVAEVSQVANVQTVARVLKLRAKPIPKKIVKQVSETEVQVIEKRVPKKARPVP